MFPRAGRHATWPRQSIQRPCMPRSSSSGPLCLSRLCQPRAVTDRCPDERQAERDIDRPAEIDGLNGDEPLVVIHGNVGVAPLPVKKGIGGETGPSRPFRKPSLFRWPRPITPSSLPSIPCSPACGLSPHTFMAGDAMPKSVLRALSVTVMQERALAVFMRPGRSLRGT